MSKKKKNEGNFAKLLFKGALGDPEREQPHQSPPRATQASGRSGLAVCSRICVREQVPERAARPGAWGPLPAITGGGREARGILKGVSQP